VESKFLNFLYYLYLLVSLFVLSQSNFYVLINSSQMVHIQRYHLFLGQYLCSFALWLPRCPLHLHLFLFPVKWSHGQVCCLYTSGRLQHFLYYLEAISAPSVSGEMQYQIRRGQQLPLLKMTWEKVS